MRRAVLLCAVAAMIAGGGLSSASGGGRAPMAHASLLGAVAMVDSKDPNSWNVSLALTNQVDYVAFMLENGGDDAIASGMATGGPTWDGSAVTTPPGFAGPALIFFTVTEPVPANTLMSFKVTLQKPISTNSGATLKVLSGPSVQSPPNVEGEIPLVEKQGGGGNVGGGGGAAPCECKSLDVKVTRTALNFSDSHRFHFQLVWTMKCGGGAGQCRGQIKIGPPAGFVITTQKKSDFNANGTPDGKEKK